MGRTRLKLHGESFEEQTALGGAHSITGTRWGSRDFRPDGSRHYRTADEAEHDPVGTLLWIL